MDQMFQHSLRDSGLHCAYNEKLKLLIKTCEFTPESDFLDRDIWITQPGAELSYVSIYLSCCSL